MVLLNGFEYVFQSLEFELAIYKCVVVKRVRLLSFLFGDFASEFSGVVLGYFRKSSAFALKPSFLRHSSAHFSRKYFA